MGKSVEITIIFLQVDPTAHLYIYPFPPPNSQKMPLDKNKMKKNAVVETMPLCS